MVSNDLLMAPDSRLVSVLALVDSNVVCATVFNKREQNPSAGELYERLVLRWMELYLFDIFQFVYTNKKSSLHTKESHKVLYWDNIILYLLLSGTIIIKHCIFFHCCYIQLLSLLASSLPIVTKCFLIVIFFLISYDL